MSTSSKTLQQITGLGTVMGIWAHPDDETFMAGGLLSMAAANGQHVICVTATDGAKGVQDASRWPAETMGETRQKEVAAALEKLGVQTHEWLGYEDGLCNMVEERDAVSKIAQLIEKHQPQTIITFAPDGVTGHPDHQAVSKWTMLAAQLTSVRPIVYFVSHTQDAYDSFWKVADEKLHIYFATNKPVFVQKEACDIHLLLEPEVAAKKTAALKAMPSQYANMFEFLGDKGVEAAVGEEAYVEASRWVYP